METLDNGSIFIINEGTSMFFLYRGDLAMNYPIVKQIFNETLDTFNNLLVKILDFGKILFMLFEAFYKILVAIFLILYFLILNLYNLIFFIIDKFFKSFLNIISWERNKGKSPYSSQRVFNIISSETPSFYKFNKKTFSKTNQAAISSTIISNASIQGAAKKLKKLPEGAKTSIISGIRKLGNNITYIIQKIFIGPFKKIFSSIGGKAIPIKNENNFHKGKGLIDEYLNEYRQTKNI